MWSLFLSLRVVSTLTISVAVWHVAVTGSSTVTRKVSANVAIAPRNSSARASVQLSLTGHPVDFFDGSIWDEVAWDESAVDEAWFEAPVNEEGAEDVRCILAALWECEASLVMRVVDAWGELPDIRDYHGCIRMHPDKYPWMVDKFLWIWMISMDYPHHPQNW